MDKQKKIDDRFYYEDSEGQLQFVPSTSVKHRSRTDGLYIIKNGYHVPIFRREGDRLKELDGGKKSKKKKSKKRKSKRRRHTKRKRPPKKKR